MMCRLAKTFAPLCLFELLLFTGCSNRPQSPGETPIAVTTSWLECVVEDITGGRFQTIRLSPPGQCPGHFDLSPGAVTRLSRCPFLFRFDFQEGLDTKLSGLTSRGLRIISVSMSGGLCVPEAYLDACRQVARALEQKYPHCAEDFRSRLVEIQSRLSQLSVTLRSEVADAGLEGRKVICSQRQASFCRWLGLDVIRELPRAENMTSSALEQILDAAERSSTRLIIANLQEGRRAADSIAERLHGSVIVFSNFPSMESNQRRFDDLVLSNIESLIREAGQ